MSPVDADAAAARREFRLPDVGEGLTEAEVVTWRVAPGDPVAVNDVLVEVESAKSVVELPSPFAGTVAQLLVEVGATVPVGTPLIAIAETGSAGPGPADASEPPPEGSDGRIPTLVGYGPRTGAARRRPRRVRPDPVAAEPVAAEPFAAHPVAAHPVGAVPVDTEPVAAHPVGARPVALVPLAKPPVRKLARDLGVDLRAVAGTGRGGVITRDDVRGAAAASTSAPVEAGGPAAVALGPTPSAPDTWREPVRGVRKATAAAVVASAFTAPHVTEFLAVDVTATMALRDRLRATSEYADVALTPLAFVAKAVCLALRRTPVLNAGWVEAGEDGAAEIVHHARVRLGIAAATPRGLLVPTIRDADTLSLRELAVALHDLAVTARDGRTPPADLTGGTFTITNVGVFGVDTGTPILVPGQAGILAVGAIKPAPWVVEGALAVRTVCRLALSFDHRLVDGEQGSRFLADVGALLTDPGLALTW